MRWKTSTIHRRLSHDNMRRTPLSNQGLFLWLAAGCRVPTARNRALEHAPGCQPLHTPYAQGLKPSLYNSWRFRQSRYSNFAWMKFRNKTGPELKEYKNARQSGACFRAFLTRVKRDIRMPGIYNTFMTQVRPYIFNFESSPSVPSAPSAPRPAPHVPL